MSAPNFAVTVIDVRGDAVRLAAEVQNEGSTVKRSRLFALAWLYEALDEVVYQRVGVMWSRPVDGPLRGAFTSDELLDWSGSSVPASEATRLDIIRDFICERGDENGGTFRVHVSDPKWLAHLQPGMRWDSYVFDDAAPPIDAA